LATGRARETQTANEDPQLSEALANLVAGLFAHIEALEQAVATLDARIGTACEPNAELVELLFTIPGVRVNTARVLIAECGVDMSVFPSALQTNSCRARTTALDTLLWCRRPHRAAPRTAPLGQCARRSIDPPLRE